MSTIENIMLFDYNVKNNHLLVAGLDEAGRGAWMGPVVAACVVLPSDFAISDINDSKKIKKEETRKELSELIKQHAVAYGIGIVQAEEIEQIGIQAANFKAFTLAFEDMDYNPEGMIPLIDGNYKGIEIPNYKSIIKGDSQSAAIASASILAKSTRDEFIKEICHTEFPIYGFDKHKGYGTKKHLEAIAEHGLTKWHRPSFCRKALERIGGVSSEQGKSNTQQRETSQCR